MASKAERFFKSKYPNARLHYTSREIAGYQIVAVYCGDYICSEGLTAQDAYKRALEYESAGYIHPDPDEVCSTDDEADTNSGDYDYLNRE